MEDEFCEVQTPTAINFRCLENQEGEGEAISIPELSVSLSIAHWIWWAGRNVADSL